MKLLVAACLLFLSLSATTANAINLAELAPLPSGCGEVL
jgi:hypothetical protein